VQLKIAQEVASALEVGGPVVALESTVIAHGLPRPQNIETALSLEKIIREAGAVPATIAVFDGEFCVGLNQSQIERLAIGENIRKISRRDLAIAAGKKLTCATTVATTAFIANRAGISVFSTGGIGGVHRGDGTDISADLVELVRTPITVVCSGAKMVLDLPATREWLETFGITALGWQCDEFPAFYSRTSGLAIDERVDNAGEVVVIVRERDEMELTNAVLLTVPVPREFELGREALEAIIDEAVAFAEKNKISGKDVTPFLLGRLSEKTGGETLGANIALLENNARVAAEIAVALAASVT
jgi:pseudouridine-5'-phosphate glycosidase